MEHQLIHTSLQAADAARIQEFYKEYRSALSEYIDRLMWWNKKINLVSRGVSRETIALHVEHSLSISGSELFQGAVQVIDTGTGGGLPGIPLAITSNEKEILLNDIVSKKIMACKHMASGLGLNNIDSSSKSIEKLTFPAPALVISKHAFKINDLLAMLNGKPWSGLVLLKGKNEVEEELEGIDIPLSIRVKDLYAGFQHEFYKGKALVEIEKKESK